MKKKRSAKEKAKVVSCWELTAEELAEINKSPESLEDRLRMELRFIAFAAVKAIVEARGTTQGTMECPMCGQSLVYSVSPLNGHLAAACSREGCLSAME